MELIETTTVTRGTEARRAFNDAINTENCSATVQELLRRYKLAIDAPNVNPTTATQELSKRLRVLSESIKEEEAKAFLIGLTFDAVGVSQRSDIVLCALGLLEGYDSIPGLTSRRKKYIVETNYQGSSKEKESPNIELPEKALGKKADSLLKSKEDGCFIAMVDFFIAENDPIQYYQEKLQEHLSPETKRQRIFRAILPKPYYLESTTLLFDTNLTRDINADTSGHSEVITLLEEYFRPNLFNYGTIIQILYGIPGVGKTYTARQYALKHFEEYNTVWFINAGSEAEIQEGVRSFVYRLEQHNIQKTPDEQKLIFLNYFNHHDNWLLIFDNADYMDQNTDENGRTMGENLQSYFPSNQSGGHILITTRCNVDFGDAKRTDVNILSEQSAINLLNSKSGLAEQNDDARSLAQELGCLPIALLYAGAYIKRFHISSYADYLKRYRKRNKKMRDNEAKLFDSKSGVVPIYRTLELIYEKLQQKSGDNALDNLREAVVQFWKISAFISPNSISLIPYVEDTANLPLPLRWLLRDEFDRDAFTDELTHYSLFQYNAANRVYSLHRLVQEFMREEVGSEDIQWANYSYHALVKQYNLYKLGGTPERADLVRGLATHMQTVMPFIAKSGLDQAENLKVAEDYCTHNEKLMVTEEGGELSDFIEKCKKECQIFEEELEYLDSVGLANSHIAAIRQMMLGERRLILYGAEELEHFISAFDISEALLDSYHPEGTFGQKDVWYLQSLYVYNACFRLIVDYIDAEHIMHYYRRIMEFVGKLEQVTYTDDAQEYYNTLYSIFMTTAELMAELSGRPIFSIGRIPYSYLPDGSPDPENPFLCYAVTRPSGFPWINDYPYTVIEGNKLHTYGFSPEQRFARPATVKPELPDLFDHIAADQTEVVTIIMKTAEVFHNSAADSYIMALPEIEGTESATDFYRILFDETCRRYGGDDGEPSYQAWLKRISDDGRLKHDSFFHFLETSPEMRKIELAEMRKMLDEIVTTIELDEPVLPISYELYEGENDSVGEEESAGRHSGL